ncbi:MAG TPA: FAD-dependent oxidoreductase [Longimicrobiaceae bacterium]|nr:FAD-dependent oxidoreductase [Longimicrobiaceae bacterium]
MVQQPLRMIILGAGYAGMLATVRLAGRARRAVRRGEVGITLVNAADSFVERLRLHQVAANQPVRASPISDILRGTGVSFVHGTVTAIDTVGRRIEVQTDQGVRQIGYDRLLYALGSTIDRDSVPGVREHAYVLTPGGPRSATALGERLLQLDAERRRARIIVCGGGATGVEASAELAEAYPNLSVHLVTQGAFGSFTTPRAAAYMHRALSRLGVTLQDHTTIAEVGADDVRTPHGSRIPHDVCLWAGGFTAPPLARESGLAVNERGQILIDPFMRSLSHPDVSAAGDAAHPVETPGAPVRMAAFTAVVMGAHGADCLSAALHGRPPRPLSFAYAGQAIALGRHDAIGFNTYPDDRPNPPYFTGRLGHETREFFVRLLADLPNIERRWPGFFTWLGKGRYAAAARREQQHGAPTASPTRSLPTSG